MHDSFCPLPWIQVSIKPSGMMTTCCVMRVLTKTGLTPSMEIQKKMQNGEIGFSRMWWENRDTAFMCGHDSIFDVLNAKLLKDVRLSMLKGEKHEACKTCWQRERYSEGKVSVRARIIKKWDHVINYELAKQLTESDGTIEPTNIRSLELRFGNKCNLKCIMCHPGHSNFWYGDWKKLCEKKTFWTDDGSGPDSFMFGGLEYSMDDETPFKWYQTEQFKKDFLQVFSGLLEIYWAGGEPLLADEHLNILNILTKYGVAENMRLRYDSNVTYLPDKIVSQWEKFKWVGVQASVDDIGVRNEYIRYPSKWETTVKNLQLLDSLGRDIAHSGTTISAYNILTFLDFAKWAKNNMSDDFWRVMHFKHVIAPFHLSPRSMPPHVKVKAIEIIEDYLQNDAPPKNTMNYVKVDMFKNYLKEEIDFFDERFYKGFIQHTINVDEIRPLKFKDCFPELYDMIKEDFNVHKA